MLLFSANDGHGPVYKFPAYDYFAPALEPLLEEVSKGKAYYCVLPRKWISVIAESFLWV